MEDQNYQEEVKYVILTQKILGNKELSSADKLVLARISGFSKFYESTEATAEFLGISAASVYNSKRKLAKLNYIVEIANTGRGKIYAPNLLQLTSRLAKNHNQTVKISQSDCEKLTTENKEKNCSKEQGDANIAEPVEKSKTEYGRADLNELEALWEHETGISIKGQQNQRRQLTNLVRKYGCEATKTLVRRVGVAIRSRDRFAPQIATPSELTGKFSKLPRLELWENRNKVARPFGNHPTPQMPDYNGAWDEKSDEERAEVSAMMREFRAKLGAKHQQEDL